MKRIEYSFSNGTYWSKYNRCRVWSSGEQNLKVRYGDSISSYNLAVSNIHNTKPTTPAYIASTGEEWTVQYTLKIIYDKDDVLHVLKTEGGNTTETVYTTPQSISEDKGIVEITPSYNGNGSALFWATDVYGNKSDSNSAEWNKDDTYPYSGDIQCDAYLHQVITTVTASGSVSPLLYSISYNNGATWSDFQYGNKFIYLNSGNAKTLKIKAKIKTSSSGNITHYLTTGTKEVYVTEYINHTPVAWLRGSGSQYIDTEIPADTIGRLEIKFNTNTVKNYNWAVGASGSTTSARSDTYGIGLSTAESNRGFAHNRFIELEFLENTVYTIDYKNAPNGSNFSCSFKWNDRTNNSSGGANDVTNQNVYLFALNYGGRAKSAEISSITLYYAKFYATDQTTLLKSFVPVLDGKGVACLYDEINGEYYYNKGTGEFIPGTYTPVNYIKSTGTQYIDTGAVADSIDITFQYDENYRADNSAFGARDAGGSNRLGLVTYSEGFHIMPPGYNIIPYDREKHHLTMGAEFDWIATMDSTTYTVTNHSVSTRTMWLFKENQYGMERKGYNIKIYDCKLYESGELLRDFIPVLDCDGIACLYDKVTHDFFYNAGTGDFITEEG